MPSPLRSMTGFARAARTLGGGQVVVTLKSVNHRGLDIHMHAPGEADAFESAIRARIKSRVARGHVDVRISLPGASGEGSAPIVNQERLAQYIAAFRAAAAAHGLDAQPDLNSAFRIPAIFGESCEPEPAEGTEAALLDSLETALAGLTAFQ